MYVVTRDAVHSGAGAAEHFAAGGAECIVAGAFVCAFLVALSAYHHPNLLHALPHFCKWGSAVPTNNLLQPA